MRRNRNKRRVKKAATEASVVTRLGAIGIRIWIQAIDQPTAMERVSLARTPNKSIQHLRWMRDNKMIRNLDDVRRGDLAMTRVVE